MSICEFEQTQSISSSSSGLDIDPRSIHVFELHGDKLLFDRATGTTSELNALAYDTLRTTQEGASITETLDLLLSRHEGLDASELQSALSELKNRGFFRFTPSHAATEDDLESLWSHRPRRLQLLMAEGCNLGCRYCYQWRNGTNQRHTLMPWSIARTSVNYLVWRSGGRKDLQVTFFGGEPLLNYPMIQRVVKYCKSIEQFTDKQFTFELITNGTLLSEDVVEFVVEHKFLLFISLDGWKEMHEYNRPSIDGQGSYETIVRNAVHANEQYQKHDLPPIKIRANLTNRHHDARRVEKFFQELGFKLMGIGAIEPLSHSDPSPSALTEDQMDSLSKQSTERMVTTLEKLKKGETPSPIEKRLINSSRGPLRRESTLGVTCGVCRNTTVVDNRGNMYPCHRYGEMEEYRIGNVSTGLDRKLVMDYYKKINGHATSECHDCWIRDYCGGGCAWLLSDKQGKIHHPTPRECVRRRRAMEDRIWLRKELRKHFPGWFEDEENTSMDNWDWNIGVEDPLASNGCSTEENPFPNLPLLTDVPASPNSGGCSSCGDPSSDGCGDCGSQSGQLVQMVPLQNGS